jgi:hypothetical protein
MDMRLKKVCPILPPLRIAEAFSFLQQTLVRPFHSIQLIENAQHGSLAPALPGLGVPVLRWFRMVIG